MSDWLGLGLIVLIVLGALCGMATLGKPYDVTPGEFEKRVEESRGMMRSGAAAGLHALQKLMNPRAAEAIEVQKDFRAGFYDDKEEVGEGDEPDIEEVVSNSSDVVSNSSGKEEEDA